MLMRYTQDGTQILKTKCNVWSSEIGGSVLGGKGRWIRTTWSSENMCQLAPSRICVWYRD